MRYTSNLILLSVNTYDLCKELAQRCRQCFAIDTQFVIVYGHDIYIICVADPYACLGLEDLAGFGISWACCDSMPVRFYLLSALVVGAASAVITRVRVHTCSCSAYLLVGHLP